jgi:hypothetical protein
MNKHIDYYSVLEIHKEASASEIKSAYRKLAKKWHPDINSDVNSTLKLQEINDAYGILGSVERRALYDAGYYAAAVDPNTHAHEAEFTPFPCDGCGAISAQPRFIQYGRVVSLILASFRSKPCGVFCVSCASKRLFLSSFITGACGWLGFWGFFWSIEVIIINILGGNKNSCLNAFVLGKQAYYFHINGNLNIARVLAKDSLGHFKFVSETDVNYNLGKIGFDLAKKILQTDESKIIKIKSHWSGWPTPSRWALFGFSLPVIFWSAVLGSYTNKQDQNISSNLSSNKYDQSSIYETSSAKNDRNVSFVGPNGQKYRVSDLDAKRLQIIYNSLVVDESAIQSKSEDLERRAKFMDVKRFNLQDNGVIDHFNKNVNQWNFEKEAYNKELNSFNIRVVEYNSELERVGTKIY